MAKKSAPKRKKAATPAKSARSTARATPKKKAKKAAKPVKKTAAAKAARRAPAKARAKAAKARPVARKAAKASVRSTVGKKTVGKKTVAKKTVAKKVVARRTASRRPGGRKTARPTPTKAAVRTVIPQAGAPRLSAVPAAAPRTPALDRARRVVRESDMAPSPPSSLVPNRHASAASSGADEMRVRLAHNPGGRELAAGDPDVDWQSAETVGDEAPGGDNPTPDQDIVEEIGRALGVQYDDDEELQGGDEIAARDHDRWELDPASSDDFEDR